MVNKTYWYDYSQKINYWETDIDYIMFIDENGNDGLINDILKRLLIIKK